MQVYLLSERNIVIIRACTQADLLAAVDITIEVFGSFYERTFHSMVDPQVYEHQHGSWTEDYRRLIPTLFAPEQDRYILLAEDRGEIAGYVAWHTDPDRRHGEIDILCVRERQRGNGIGRSLCERAIDSMRDRGVEVVQIGTGGDDFHAPARHLYESLGFSPVPAVTYLRSIEHDARPRRPR